MILHVFAIAVHEDGMPHWTYEHREQYVPPADGSEETFALEAGSVLIQRVDEAAEVLSRQIGVDVGRLRAEGEK